MPFTAVANRLSFEYCPDGRVIVFELTASRVSAGPKTNSVPAIVCCEPTRLAEYAVLLPFNPPSRPPPLNAVPSTTNAFTLYAGDRFTSAVPAGVASTVSCKEHVFFSEPEVATKVIDDIPAGAVLLTEIRTGITPLVALPYVAVTPEGNPDPDKLTTP